MKLAAVTATVVALGAYAVQATSGGASHQLTVTHAEVDGHGVKWWAARARANGDAMRWQKKRVRALERELRPVRESTVQAIAYVFGPYAGQALRVAYCESRLYTGAVNGQYRNVFQMGESERKRYGWHDAYSPAWMAALAAWRYFVESGYSWRAWACRP